MHLIVPNFVLRTSTLFLWAVTLTRNTLRQLDIFHSMMKKYTSQTLRSLSLSVLPQPSPPHARTQHWHVPESPQSTFLSLSFLPDPLSSQWVETLPLALLDTLNCKESRQRHESKRRMDKGDVASLASLHSSSTQLKEYLFPWPSCSSQVLYTNGRWLKK